MCLSRRPPLLVAASKTIALPFLLAHGITDRAFAMTSYFRQVHFIA